MPLENGSSKQVISHNIEEMQNSGHPHNQAVAAALHNAKDEELGFKKLESKVAAGGASDPAAVAAKIGREKYGQREMTAKSEAGKTAKDADIGNPNHDPKNGQFASGHVVAVNKQSGKKTQLTSTPVTAPEAKTIISKQSDASNKVNNYEHHVALKPADGEQRHVAGNKVYPSAEHAIKAANAEHAKSGAILGVEKYDPQKHPNATLATKSFPTDRSAGKGPVSPSTGRPERPSIAGGEKQRYTKPTDPYAKAKIVSNMNRSEFMSKYGTTAEKAEHSGNSMVHVTPEASQQIKENHSALRNKVAANRGAEAAAEFEGPVKADPAVEKSKVYSRDAQPGMITQQNSGGPTWKGKNLDDNPVGDSYGSGDCAASPDAAAWPGRTL